MPVWHEATRQLQADGRITMVGIVQEQHPDRARLFMQWKQMAWPVMVDAQNELGVAVVPVTIFIDEHGIVRDLQPPRQDPAAAAEAFAATSFDAPAQLPDMPSLPDLTALSRAAKTGTAAAYRAYGTGIVNWGDPSRAGEAIEAFRQALELEPEDGPTHFRRGVAYRRRAESEYRQYGDFQRAVTHWGNALAIDPNQYIWRRRIQQYGPRLDKPYSFYDWVTQARFDIEARGETPHALPVEPSGAEFAYPQRSFSAAGPAAGAPEEHERVQRDGRRLILAETTVVPATAMPGDAVRVHLAFRPNEKVQGHWNNEAEPMQVRVKPRPDWRVDRQVHMLPNAPAATSLETRRLEFEVHVPEDAAPGPVRLSAYALYNVCEGPAGTCLYRRHDITVEIRVGGED